MSLHIEGTIVARDHIGRFVSECEAAATKTVEEAAVQMAKDAKALAPVKTGKLVDSIEPVVFSARSGGAVVGTDHWQYQERGTSRHGIPGNVSFFWEREGRWWKRGDNVIDHPGNPAVHFMRKAYKIAADTIMAKARENFPG